MSMYVPDDSLVREEWGARITWPEGHTEDWWATNRAQAVKWVFYHDGEYSVCTSELIRRYIVTTPAEVISERPKVIYNRLIRKGDRYDGLRSKRNKGVRGAGAS